MSAETGFDIPVAMIVFNRPELTRAVFEQMRKVRPQTLFVIADGARDGRPGEAERVDAVRRIFDEIDWPCDLRTDFATANMGCRDRVASGISLVFGQVERAIILEDDCWPAPSFFPYCRAMLDRYAKDRRIFSVSGTCFADDEQAPPGHYYSRFSLMWGWATWRDRWQEYALSPEDTRQVVCRTWPGSPLRQLFWTSTIDRAAAPVHATWDWQWILTLWRNNALAVRPTRNLVRNLGFGVDATHTHSAEARAAKLPVFEELASFTEGPAEMAADPVRDSIDERDWAGLNWKTALALRAPFLLKIRRLLR